MNEKKLLFLLKFSTLFIMITAQNPISNSYYKKTKFENSTGLYFEPIEKIKIYGKENHLMPYTDIKKILSFQNSLINIFEGAVNFCRITKDNSYCNNRHSNKKFIILKSKIENVIE